MFGFNNNIGAEGERIIDALYNKFKRNPAYANLNITKGYDGSTYIQISNGGYMLNRFSFYGMNGKLHSIAIYGANIRELMNSINSSKQIFGLPVSEVSWEGDYIDITLD